MNAIAISEIFARDSESVAAQDGKSSFVARLLADDELMLVGGGEVVVNFD